MRRCLLLLLALLTLAAGEDAPTDAGRVRVGANPSAVAFFEAKIRPVLIKHCHECHGGGKRYGGLKTDSYDSLLAGGHDEGPAVIPGDTVNSALLRSLRWEGDSDLNMPPVRKLPDEIIRDFERWVEIGAPWPDPKADVVQPAPPPQPLPPLFGRLHPVLVHLPVACLLLALVAEVLVLLRGERWKPATALLVAAGTIGAALAAASGVALEDGQDPHLLERHELLGWLTLAGALTASGMLITMRWVPLRRWPLVVVLAITAILVAWTGHLGGEMVWGGDWL